MIDGERLYRDNQRRMRLIREAQLGFPKASLRTASIRGPKTREALDRPACRWGVD